jgi:hypothetical protein
MASRGLLTANFHGIHADHARHHIDQMTIHAGQMAAVFRPAEAFGSIAGASGLPSTRCDSAAWTVHIGRAPCGAVGVLIAHAPTPTRSTRLRHALRRPVFSALDRAFESRLPLSAASRRPSALTSDTIVGRRCVSIGTEERSYCRGEA